MPKGSRKLEESEVQNEMRGFCMSKEVSAMVSSRFRSDWARRLLIRSHIKPADLLERSTKACSLGSVGMFGEYDATHEATLNRCARMRVNIETGG